MKKRGMNKQPRHDIDTTLFIQYSFSLNRSERGIQNRGFPQNKPAIATRKPLNSCHTFLFQHNR